MKKLALKKETLRNLQDADLSRVIGGTGGHGIVGEPMEPEEHIITQVHNETVVISGCVCPSTTTFDNYTILPVEANPLPL